MTIEQTTYEMTLEQAEDYTAELMETYSIGIRLRDSELLEYAIGELLGTTCEFEPSTGVVCPLTEEQVQVFNAGQQTVREVLNPNDYLQGLTLSYWETVHMRTQGF